MKYRLAIEEDFPQLAELRWDFQTEDASEKPIVEKAEFLEKCIGYLQKSSARGDWFFWIAEHNGEIVSQMFVHMIESVPRPARLENFWGYLTNVYTKPAFRGRGTGAQLLRKVRSWAVEQDFELLIVSPSDDSINFYKREGFAEQTDFFQLRLREF